MLRCCSLCAPNPPPRHCFPSARPHHGAHHHQSTFLLGKLDSCKPLLPPALYSELSSWISQEWAGRAYLGRDEKSRTDILCLGLNIYGGEQCPRTDLCSVLKGPEVCCHLGKEDLLSFGNWPFCDVRHPLCAWMILMRSCTILARVLSWTWEQLSPWPNLTQAPLSPLLDWASTLPIALSDLPSSVLTRILKPSFRENPYLWCFRLVIFQPLAPSLCSLAIDPQMSLLYSELYSIVFIF